MKTVIKVTSLWSTKRDRAGFDLISRGVLTRRRLCSRGKHAKNLRSQSELSQGSTSRDRGVRIKSIALLRLSSLGELRNDEDGVMNDVVPSDSSETMKMK